MLQPNYPFLGLPGAMLVCTLIMIWATHQALSIRELATREWRISQIAGNIDSLETSSGDTEGNSTLSAKPWANELSCRRDETGNSFLQLMLE